MDDTDFSLFSNKKDSKHDKADAASTNSQPSNKSAETEKKVIVSRPTVEELYNNNYPRTGIALIFNHKDVKGQKQRLGTERDRDSMVRSLSAYGFETEVHNDLTFADLYDVLKTTASADHSQYDCFVLVVMSHGAEGKVFARDMAYPVERLWNPFLGDNCKSLINKPKLFFIQACRGQNLEKAVTYTGYAPMSRDLNEAPEKPPVITYAIPNTADLLVMYSTFDKYFSFRNVENGSWFIQTLCAVMDEASRQAATSEGIELLRLLTTVNRRVAYEFQSNAKTEALNQMKEMPNFLSTLTKMFYLRAKPKV